MGAKGLTLTIILVLVILGVVGGALYSGGFFQQALGTGSVAFVGVPEFGNIICSQASVGEVDKVIDVPDKNPHTYTCGAPEISSYVPNGCDIYVRLEGAVIGGYKLTKIDSSGNRKPLVVSGLRVGQDNFVTKLSQGEKVEADVTGLFYDAGDLKLRMRATPFTLKSTESGFLRETENCGVRSLASNYHPASQVPEDTLRPGQIVNYVLFSKSVVGDSVLNLITLDGKEVYAYKPGAYYEVKTTADGFKYVDASRSFADNKIECNPSNTLVCDRSAKVKVGFEGKTTGFGGSGVPEGYAPVPGTDKACLFEARGGKIVNTGDCKIIPKTCPADKPVYKSDTVECVAGSKEDGVGCPASQEPVEKETKTCSGRLLCELGITDEEVITVRSCVPKTTWVTYLPLILLGIALLVIAFFVPLRKK